MIIAFTGHRPEKLGGYNSQNPMQVWVFGQLKDTLVRLAPTKCISGMALGVDQIAARVCSYLKIPWTAAIPFVGQEAIWPCESQQDYWDLIRKATDVMVCSSGGHSSEKYQIRDEWMVDHADLLVAVWDGTRGGTGNTVKYAKLVKKPIWRIDPKEKKCYMMEG